MVLSTLDMRGDTLARLTSPPLDGDPSDDLKLEEAIKKWNNLPDSPDSMFGGAIPTSKREDVAHSPAHSDQDLQEVAWKSLQRKLQSRQSQNPTPVEDGSTGDNQSSRHTSISPVEDLLVSARHQTPVAFGSTPPEAAAQPVAAQPPKAEESKQKTFSQRFSWINDFAAKSKQQQHHEFPEEKPAEERYSDEEEFEELHHESHEHPFRHQRGSFVENRASLNHSLPPPAKPHSDVYQAKVDGSFKEVLSNIKVEKQAEDHLFSAIAKRSKEIQKTDEMEREQAWMSLQRKVVSQKGNVLKRKENVLKDIQTSLSSYHQEEPALANDGRQDEGGHGDFYAQSKAIDDKVNQAFEMIAQSRARRKAQQQAQHSHSGIDTAVNSLHHKFFAPSPATNRHEDGLEDSSTGGWGAGETFEEFTEDGSSWGDEHGGYEDGSREQSVDGERPGDDLDNDMMERVIEKMKIRQSHQKQKLERGLNESQTVNDWKRSLRSAGVKSLKDLYKSMEPPKGMIKTGQRGAGVRSKKGVTRKEVQPPQQHDPQWFKMDKIQEDLCRAEQQARFQVRQQIREKGDQKSTKIMSSKTPIGKQAVEATRQGKWGRTAKMAKPGTANPVVTRRKPTGPVPPTQKMEGSRKVRFPEKSQRTTKAPSDPLDPIVRAACDDKLRNLSPTKRQYVEEQLRKQAEWLTSQLSA